jgi:hypothetical protein
MKQKRYTLWSYDVWGNARDGWEVNDRSCLSREFIVEHSTDDGPTDSEMLEALKECGYVKHSATTADVEFEWTDNGYEVSETSNGFPLYGLEENE